MKKLIGWMLTLVLALTFLSPALAAEGDRSLIHLKSTDGYMTGYIENVFPLGEDIAVLYNGAESAIHLYRAGSDAPEIYSLNDENEAFLPHGADESWQYDQNVAWFVLNQELYAVQTRTTVRGDQSEVEGGWIRRVTLKDGKVLMEDTDYPQLDWTNMVQDYGTWSETRSMNTPLVIGNSLIARSWDNSGESVLLRFDLTSGFSDEIYVRDASEIYPGPDGSLLFLRYQWEDADSVYKLHLIRFDPDTGSEEEVASVDAMEQNFSGFCYDDAADLLYYVENGEIKAAPAMQMDQAVAVSDCPLSQDVRSILLPGGRILLWSSQDVMLRSTDPSARGEKTSLVIRDSVYAESFPETTYAFGNARSDVAVIYHRGGSASDLLQAMMNQDGSIDIYTLDYASSEFDALRSRGYLADLSGNAALTAAVDTMVPYLQEALRQDGRLIAVPVSLYGNCLGIRREFWENLGGTEEDLPRTWNQFFDWIEGLPEKLAGKDIAVFDRYTSRSSFRSSILTAIVNQYQALINDGSREYAFNTPLLRGLLDRLDKLDYDALGIPEDSEMERMMSMEGSEYKEPLLDTYVQLTVTSWDTNWTPLRLSIEEDADPILPLSMGVAFVNPYSAHQQEAAEYLALSLDNLDVATRYSVFANLTEPIRDPGYAENRKQLESMIAMAKENLEKADPEDRENAQQILADYEDSLAEQEKNAWLISAESIQRYRERVPYLRPLSYDFVSGLVSSRESAENFYEILQGYTEGQISTEEFLSSIDKKVQMMRLEGN